ncbi:MAG: hypothetical protein L0H79_18045 [Intrasporangium sp.]|uniref:hypothetical protein n=1 Tax=Intrasporangium sp. TaxID=1925024 RepID=UPI00264739F4|nr:hypothetical protein [Intrasporangium sp.]MDN5797630.1 hypothetical protein [Intrasporangium sp.]
MSSTPSTTGRRGPHRTGRRQRLVRFGTTGTDWSLHHLLLAAVATLGVALYLLALQGATGGKDAGWWLLTAVPLLTWSLSNSAAALALWSVLVVVWVNLTPAGSFTWWSLLAALGVTLSHAATALADSRPPWAYVGRATARGWLRPVVVAVAAATVVAVLAALLLGRAGGLSGAAYVIGLAGLAAGVWALRTNPPQEPD